MKFFKLISFHQLHTNLIFRRCTVIDPINDYKITEISPTHIRETKAGRKNITLELLTVFHFYRGNFSREKYHLIKVRNKKKYFKILK